MSTFYSRAVRSGMLLFLGVALSACGGDAEHSESAVAGRGYADADMAVAEEQMALVPSQAPAPGSPDRRGARPSMLVRNGSATIEVDELDSAVVAVRGIVERMGGFLANVGIMGGADQTRMAVLSMRVPADRFDATLAALDSLGEVEQVHIDSEDVGEQYADLEVRIANARRLEARLLELLATRTGSLEDVLAVERELARVREEIERTDAHMRSIRDRVALSTLSVTLHEPQPLFSQGPGDNVLVRAVRQAGRNFVGFVGAAIASLGVLVPLLVLLVLAGWAWRRIGARRRRKRGAD